MTFGSLFAGIGGFDLGLERAGMECAWQVENDPYCQRVLTKHWPEVRRYGDIKEVEWSEVERVDLVCGGFPCQPVSTAGKQLRQADDRWLWPEFARCVREIRPRFVLVENVPGLLAGGMGDVLGDLARLGYDAEWQSLPAAAFGAPHLRWRVWIVAHCDGRRLESVWGSGIFDSVGASFWNDAYGCSGEAEVAYAEGAGAQVNAESGGCSGADGEKKGARSNYRGDANSREHSWWSTEPDVGLLVDGVPCRLAGHYRLAVAHDKLTAYADATKASTGEVLRAVRDAATPEVILGWASGGSFPVPTSQVLFAFLRELEATGGTQPAGVALESSAASGAEVRSVRADEAATRPPCRRADHERPAEQPPDSLHALSQLLARDAGEAWLEACGKDAVSAFRGLTVPRVAQNVPARVDRLRGLGNAVVPQVAEWIGRRIMEAAQ